MNGHALRCCVVAIVKFGETRLSSTCREIQVYFLPSGLDGQSLDGCQIVMTDVLRASTTMVTALENGARDIWTHAQIEEARQAAKSLEGSLLCGERQGKIIDGFDLGNSPLEFNRETVDGKTIVQCTTNGTVALESCHPADRVLVGAFVNLQAVVRQLLNAEKAVVLCAGTYGKVTGEDVAFAGAVVSRMKKSAPDLKLNDQAMIAESFWRQIELRTETGDRLSDVLCECFGGRNLLPLNYQPDIEFCAHVDLYSTVPELNRETGRIELMNRLSAGKSL